MSVRVSQIWLMAGVWLVVDAGRRIAGLSPEPVEWMIAGNVTLVLFVACLTIAGLVNRRSEKSRRS